MRYLVLGCNGMAGHIICQYLMQKGHDVIGFAREKSDFVKTIVGDAFDEKLLRYTISNNNFDFVINCIGVLNKAVDENIKTGIYINSYFPHLVASICDNNFAKFIHLSTDCVFSGKKGSYTQDDIADEVSLYGRTKFLGEVVYKNNLTIRTSIIGPELKENGIGLFDWFMKQDSSVSGYTDVFWSGVTTLELAKFIEKIVPTDINGLYFLTNNEKISKYDLICLFSKYCRKDSIRIEKNNILKSDKSIVNTRTDFKYDVPSYDVMIKQMSEWISGNKNMYFRYIKD